MSAKSGYRGHSFCHVSAKEDQWMKFFNDLVDNRDKLQISYRNALLNETEQVYKLERYKSYCRLCGNLESKQIFNKMKTDLKVLQTDRESVKKEIQRTQRQLKILMRNSPLKFNMGNRHSSQLPNTLRFIQLVKLKCTRLIMIKINM